MQNIVLKYSKEKEKLVSEVQFNEEFVIYKNRNAIYRLICIENHITGTFKDTYTFNQLNTVLSNFQFLSHSHTGSIKLAIQEGMKIQQVTYSELTKMLIEGKQEDNT